MEKGSIQHQGCHGRRQQGIPQKGHCLHQLQAHNQNVVVVMMMTSLQMNQDFSKNLPFFLVLKGNHHRHRLVSLLEDDFYRLIIEWFSKAD
jgi:hypothetical protein